MVFLTHHLTEHFSEAWRHEVIQDGIDHGAQVEEDAGKKMHILKDMVFVCSPVVNVAPHDTIDVKRSPADSKHNHQCTCQTQHVC